jgi:hypothetical protein
MRRSAAISLVLVLLATSACASRGPGSPPAVASAAPSASQDPRLPSGWRWESYGGVEVGVPGEWGWGNGNQRLSQWCVGPKDHIAQPIVGRPGATSAAGCPTGTNPRPETLIKNTGLVVGLDTTAEPPGTRQEGDQTTVRLDGVLITVNAPAALRQRIVETVHRVQVDSHGCPATHPISQRPQQRPAKPVSLPSLRAVASVSACKFALAGGPYGANPRLMSALRLDGSAAAAAIREAAKAPLGGGPDDPADCLPSVSYGDEAIVLLVRSAAGPTEIVLRYAGCDHNGFDDGGSVRSLTARAVAPFITGSNTVLNASGGPDKWSMLQPPPARR